MDIISKKRKSVFNSSQQIIKRRRTRQTKPVKIDFNSYYKPQNCWLLNLPVELLSEIVSYFNPEKSAAISQSCKFFYLLIHCQQYWLPWLNKFKLKDDIAYQLKHIKQSLFNKWLSVEQRLTCLKYYYNETESISNNIDDYIKLSYKVRSFAYLPAAINVPIIEMIHRAGQLIIYLGLSKDNYYDLNHQNITFVMENILRQACQKCGRSTNYLRDTLRLEMLGSTNEPKISLMKLKTIRSKSIINNRHYSYSLNDQATGQVLPVMPFISLFQHQILYIEASMRLWNSNWNKRVPLDHDLWSKYWREIVDLAAG